MNRVSDVLNFLTELAPIEKALDFDNVGLLIGNVNAVCNKIILALDVSSDVVSEAIKSNADLVVSHHPLIFNPINRLLYNDPQGKKIIDLIENKISLISMHTNLDAAEEGVNRALADRLELNPEHALNTETNIGLVGKLPKCRFEDFLKKVNTQLGSEAIRYKKSQKFVEKIAICGGAGADEFLNAKSYGCDTYLTSEVKHHQWIEAGELGINLIDAGHFETENPVIFTLERMLEEKFFDIDIFLANNNKRPYSYFTE